VLPYNRADRQSQNHAQSPCSESLECCQFANRDNFHDGDYLLIDEISYRFGEPARGDVIVFRYPENPSQFFIKRIVALPSETVKIEASKVVIINSEFPNQKLLLFKIR
jgi:signal peptidase I